ncbi:hypothetical protein SAMN02910292_02631 [Lachnospiraceae bacterium XBB2008]|nr:hypothetical protein SAMN02910292_02631 [Lachnospiraceae bacterium XBB2008]
MLDACRSRCEKEGLANVSYVEADFNRVSVADLSAVTAAASADLPDAGVDCVLACLNPSTYNPEAFDKLLSITGKVLVYFTMDTDIGNPDAEPVYCGCNSVRFAEEYLKEMGLRYTKIPYVYELEMEGRDPVNINFAYLIIRKV